MTTQDPPPTREKSKYASRDTNALFDEYLAAEGGEKEAIAEELYQRGKALCMGTYWRGHSRTMPIEVAEDLFHDAWMYTLERGKPGGNFRGYLIRTFTSKAIDWHRRASREIIVDPGEERFWDSVLGAEKPVDPEPKQRLEQTIDCLSSLPERQRRTMQLFLSGRSTEEIERRVGGSTKDLVYNARQNMRECLKQRHGWTEEDFVRLSLR